MITITPKHWLFFFCLLASAALVFITLRILVIHPLLRELGLFVLILAACGAGWGTWAHVCTQNRIDQLEETVAEQGAAQREALALRKASRSKGNLSSVE
jgi:hypothetical protein